MKLEVNGREYGNFVSASAEIRLDALSNSFLFQAAATEQNLIPLQTGDACKVKINNETIITGRIERVDISYDSKNHNITVSGRDKTGDLVDSSLGAISDIKASRTLKGVIEIIINHLGLDISVIDQVNPPKFTETDIDAPEPGQNAFEFIENLARKRQVILTSNADGNIVIVSTPGASRGEVLQHIKGKNSNNILSASFSDDITGRFNRYEAISSLNGLTSFVNTIALVNQKGVFVDPDIRAGRQLVLVTEQSSTNNDGLNRAEWEQRIRKARSGVYGATVYGFTSVKTGNRWDVNTIVAVTDDFIFSGESKLLLVNSVRFNLGLEDGSTTTLSLVDRNSYNLKLQEPKEKSQSNIF